MSVSLQRLDQVEASRLATTLRNAGVAGAGGAGFPSYAKWERLDEVDHLLVNHQESEPNYYKDKRLGRDRSVAFAELFEALLDGPFETVVVGAKEKDREEWNRTLERRTDATVYGPEDLPLDPDDEAGVVFAYTEDRYEYGMESVLLRMVADVVIGNELPMDHGWIVQNTETMLNVYRAFTRSEPTIRKFVHVDGEGVDHRFLTVPVGTTADVLLEAGGCPVAELADDLLLADGGPGWCFEIERDPASFGVTKRTNCLLVVDEGVARENTLGDDRINVLSAGDWDGDHETEPTRLDPSRVRIPLITNEAFEGLVTPSDPIVSVGDEVEAGEMIARPASDGISMAQHASIDGQVATVTDSHVEIRRPDADGATAAELATDRSGAAGEPQATDHHVYWTMCAECGAYVVEPERMDESDPTYYVCEDCR